MIQTLAKKITLKIFHYGFQKEIFEVHSYGIEVIISTLIDAGIILIIGFYTEHFMESVFYYILFGLMRKFSGGYHCNTYLTCISLHVMLFVVYVMTHSYYELCQNHIIIFSIVVFLFLSPIKNRKLEEVEYKRYRLVSMFLLMIYIMLINLQIYNGIIAYVILIISILMIVCVRKNEKQIF